MTTFIPGNGFTQSQVVNAKETVFYLSHAQKSKYL